MARLDSIGPRPQKGASIIRGSLNDPARSAPAGPAGRSAAEIAHGTQGPTVLTPPLQQA